jgi:hypothetical protein
MEDDVELPWNDHSPFFGLSPNSRYILCDTNGTWRIKQLQGLWKP